MDLVSKIIYLGIILAEVGGFPELALVRRQMCCFRIMCQTAGIMCSSPY